jgi:hypothetical protein
MRCAAEGGLGGNGGLGGDGGSGGAAQGGGLYVDAASIAALAGGSIVGNQADGGRGGLGDTDGANGPDGYGQGGGVYLAGLGSTRKGTKIAGNAASTSGDEIFGTFS